MAGAMAALDLLVHAPLEPEGFGLILVEAMASGCPVVAVPRGGIAEVISDGVTGLLVAPDDPAALAGAIVRVMDDPLLAQRLGSAGRAAAATRFSVDRQAAEVEALYDSLCHPVTEAQSVVPSVAGG
ncbi:MAG TPA: glycosyltransferase [Chloroflexia bacterium]|nr:glycosyltransferase [Chloroflexia bacterium]